MELDNEQVSSALIQNLFQNIPHYYCVRCALLTKDMASGTLQEVRAWLSENKMSARIESGLKYWLLHLAGIR